MATEENFNMLAKLPVSTKIWTNEFNEDNQNSYINKDLIENNNLDHAEYITSEEASTILINKMKLLQNLYADHLKSLKHEYILGRDKVIEQIKSGESGVSSPFHNTGMHGENSKIEKIKESQNQSDKMSGLSNQSFNELDHSEGYLKRKRKLMNAYLRYHRPLGEEGFFALRSKERRLQFSGDKLPPQPNRHYPSRSKASNNKLGVAFYNNHKASFGPLARCQATLTWRGADQAEAKPSPPAVGALATRSSHGTGSKKGKSGKASGKSTCGLDYKPHPSSLGSGSHNATRCPASTLPSSKFCRAHILQDPKQQLFVPCGAPLNPVPGAGLTPQGTDGRTMAEKSATCQIPVPNTISLYGPRCPLHFVYKVEPGC